MWFLIKRTESWSSFGVTGLENLRQWGLMKILAHLKEGFCVDKWCQSILGGDTFYSTIFMSIFGFIMNDTGLLFLMMKSFSVPNFSHSSN